MATAAAITGAAVPLREIMIDVLVLVNASPAGHFARVAHVAHAGLCHSDYATTKCGKLGRDCHALHVHDETHSRIDPTFKINTTRVASSLLSAPRQRTRNAHEALRRRGHDPTRSRDQGS